MPGIKSIVSSIGLTIAFLFIGLVSIGLIVGGLGALFGPPVSPKDVPVVEVKGSLAEGPEISSFGKHRYIKLILNEYPSRSFNIEGDAYYAAKYPLMNDNLFKGDTVFLAVSPDDYKRNIEQYKESEYVLPVAVYQCSSRQHVFLSLADYCKEANSDTGAGIIALLIGSGLGLAVILSLLQMKKRRSAKSRKLPTANP